MRNMAAISSDESTILILCIPEWSPTQVRFAMRLMISWWVHFLFLLFITFRTNVLMSIIPSPYSFLFALHLEWSLNISTGKKSNAICIFVNLCSTLFSLWFKFSSAWFYFLSKCTKERGKKLTRKNLNVDRQSFKNVICIFLMLLCLN